MWCSTFCTSSVKPEIENPDCRRQVSRLREELVNAGPVMLHDVLRPQVSTAGEQLEGGAAEPGKSRDASPGDVRVILGVEHDDLCRVDVGCMVNGVIELAGVELGPVLG